MQHFSGCEAVIMMLLYPELEGFSIIISAPIAEILTFYSYAGVKKALKSLYEKGCLYRFEKGGYYSITKLGKSELLKVKEDSDYDMMYKQLQYFQKTGAYLPYFDLERRLKERGITEVEFWRVME
ncbi:hypothetical protein [Methanococcus maripaludis]|uniref:ArnR1-like winged helix-turn-helix domain-containing protein n=1 Tax=Methanococcus maripaludis OS7 TaxID=637915 RepID=A0A2Z5PEU0_METMI|nr:hypothetical protein [Methanococcus maripaludis]BAP62122.1 hypothetical protein MMOS7_00360 [Methanococcus maripaludis OS7]